MSQIDYRAKAQAAITQAALKAAEVHPQDDVARLAFCVGILQAELLDLASRATVESQPQCTANRIAKAMTLNPDQAADIVDAVSASLKCSYEEMDLDGYDNAITSLNTAVKAIWAIADELEHKEAA